MKSISIYIHIPFCVKKCQYCDFLSAPADSRAQEVYLRALKQEIREQAARYREYEVQTVFIGGGTPTAVPCENLCEVLKTVFSFYRMNPHAEISMEANPGTVTKEALLSYRKAGINRISIGLQSADDVELKLLGRIHTYRDFQQTYRWAQEAGFTNINLDIMSALPGQSVENYKKTLETILSLKPQHISAYSLIVEVGTPFYEKYGQESEKLQATGEKQPDLPSEEEEREMYALTEKLLAAAGYHRYEISNYALPGRECRHNLVYWKRGNYVGFGLGAASMVENVRFENIREMQEYLAEYAGMPDAEPVFAEVAQRDAQVLPNEQESSLREDTHSEDEQELSIRENVHPLSPQEQMEETMFLGLRLTEGVSKAEFHRQFGVSMEQIYGEVIRKNTAKGLLIDEAGYVCLTREGMDLSNYVMAQFLLDEV
ncbi:putative oxygen-independent coproporphyrinogen III oxidase [Clostridium sp. CAG:510]|nr:putative oxygen-independent coproporphyrinogen III oxidase [Clostridium sp. CAG:510]